MANMGGLAVGYGVPIMVQYFSPDGKINSQESAEAWFITMTIYAIVGLFLLIFCYTQTQERVVMDEKDDCIGGYVAFCSYIVWLWN